MDGEDNEGKIGMMCWVGKFTKAQSMHNVSGSEILWKLSRVITLSVNFQ